MRFDDYMNKFRIKNSMDLNILDFDNKIKSIHPMNIINNVHIGMFKVKIEYITARKHKKQRELCFLIDTYNPQYDFSSEIKNWESSYNKKKNIHKQISNVTILESLCEGFLRI